MVNRYSLDGSNCGSYYGCSAKMVECDKGGAYVLATDYAALEAERDEWKRRAWEAVELIRQHAPKVHVYTKYEGAGTSIRVKEDRLYDRAYQIVSSKMCISRIAEGRDNG